MNDFYIGSLVLIGIAVAVVGIGCYGTWLLESANQAIQDKKQAADNAVNLGQKPQ